MSTTPPLRVERDGAAHVLTMREPGLATSAFSTAFEAALDAIEKSDEPACLVLTGEGKSFSTGFDVEVLAAGGEAASRMIADGIRLLGRLLGSPVPSVAAIGGHAFGLGAMMATACDWRVMREDRGFFCLPELDMGVPLAPSMTAVLQCKLPAAALRDAVLTSARIGGARAAELGIVDEACPASALLERAKARVVPLAEKSRDAYGALKRSLYREVLEVIEGAD